MIPPRTNDDGYFSAAWNQLREAVRSHEPIAAPGIFTSHTVHGVVREAEPAPAVYGTAGAEVTLYRLKSVQDDYLTCRTWDGTTEGTTDVYIAKPPKLRHSITTETIEGVSYTYTYTTGPDSLNKYRIAKVTGQTAEFERCVVTPEWLANDLIYAITADTLVEDADENDIALLLLNTDARAWAKHA